MNGSSPLRRAARGTGRTASTNRRSFRAEESGRDPPEQAPGVGPRPVQAAEQGNTDSRVSARRADVQVLLLAKAPASLAGQAEQVLAAIHAGVAHRLRRRRGRRPRQGFWQSDGAEGGSTVGAARAPSVILATKLTSERAASEARLPAEDSDQGSGPVMVQEASRESVPGARCRTAGTPPRRLLRSGGG